MYTAADDIVWKTKKDMLILLNTKTGHYFTLNPIAGLLWNKLVVESKSFDDAVQAVIDDCENAPQKEIVVSDCNEIIENWKNENLILAKN